MTTLNNLHFCVCARLYARKLHNNTMRTLQLSCHICDQASSAAGVQAPSALAMTGPTRYVNYELNLFSSGVKKAGIVDGLSLHETTQDERRRLRKAAEDNIMPPRRRMALPSMFWNDVFSCSGIDLPREGTLAIDLRCLLDRTGSDRWHLGTSGKFQLQLMQTQMAKQQFLLLWESIFNAFKAGPRCVCMNIFCSSGRHRSVAFASLALHCGRRIPGNFFLEHLCKSNWNLGTCNNCEDSIF